MNTKTYKQILEEIEVRRSSAVFEAEKLQQQLFKQFPRLKTIQTEIADAGITLFQDQISGMSLDSARQKYDKAVAELETERLRILSDAGLSPEDLLPKYACPICKDSGFVKGHKCHCLKTLLSESFFHRYDLSPHAKAENFKTFDIDIFEEANRPRMQKIYSACWKLCHEFDAMHSSFLFTGLPGRGKTFMCNCIAGDLIEKGRHVIYITAAHLAQMARDYTSDSPETEKSKLFDAFKSCDLLIIDDLGAEYQTDFSNTILFDVINTRLMAKQKMIISTNLTIEDIGNRYDPRLSSRINAYFKVIPFIGEDVRVVVKQS